VEPIGIAVERRAFAEELAQLESPKEASMKHGRIWHRALAISLPMTAIGLPMPARAALCQERAIQYYVEVPAQVADVWRAWTTEQGLEEWLARGAALELETLGRFEILFDPDAPVGSRGAENNRILAIQPLRMLSFTWDAPPHLPEARAQRTMVILRLSETEAGDTGVQFTQIGWGDGGQWDEAFDYFTGAWRYVLAMLLHRFETGEPLDFDQPPTEEELASVLTQVLSGTGG
jgi:uncharacterized protein YndB with AHSA1/START domain